MKRIVFPILTLLVILTITSCVKKDNYDAPDQILTGVVIDASTGQPLQAEQGTSSFSIRAYETSWNNGVGVTAQDFNVKYDGTFVNSKLFMGTYQLYPFNGAFVPLVYTNSAGALVDNGSQTVKIEGGTTSVTFTVEPFLKIEWVGEPVVNADRTVTVNCKFSRGTAQADRIFNVTDVFLFVGTTAFVGNSSYDNVTSPQVKYSGTAGNALLGQTVTLTTKPLGAKRPYYVRVGARTADNVNKRYNYNAPKQVNVP
jgi:hypothetical protein